MIRNVVALVFGIALVVLGVVARTPPAGAAIICTGIPCYRTPPPPPPRPKPEPPGWKPQPGQPVGLFFDLVCNGHSQTICGPRSTDDAILMSVF